MSNPFSVNNNQHIPIRHAGEDVDPLEEDNDFSNGVTFNYQASHTYGDVTINQSNFAEYDSNNDGQISFKEFKAKVGDNPEAIKAWKAEGKADWKNNGFNKGHDSPAGVNGISKSMNESSVSGSLTINKENFRTFDRDNDKIITRAEFTRQLNRMQIPKSEIENILALFNKISGGDDEIALTDLENATAPAAETPATTPEAPAEAPATPPPVAPTQ